MWRECIELIGYCTVVRVTGFCLPLFDHIPHGWTDEALHPGGEKACECPSSSEEKDFEVRTRTESVKAPSQQHRFVGTGASEKNFLKEIKDGTVVLEPDGPSVISNVTSEEQRTETTDGI